MGIALMYLKEEKNFSPVNVIKSKVASCLSKKSMK